jgi:membrane-associated protease RseP (regulator of RpoE activity)
VLAAKLAAFNLLPLPPLNGGMIVVSVLGWKKGLPEKILIAVCWVGLTLVVMLFGYWAAQFATIIWELL